MTHVQTDQTNLLQALTIERRPDAPRRRRRWAPHLAAMGGACLAALMLPASPAGLATTAERAAIARVGGGVDPGRAAGPRAGRVDAAPGPVAEAKPDRQALTASGYVVARRKSIVGSEVLGKIVAVDVDEGSLVEKGQVIARLDDVIGRHDLDLARARIGSARAAEDAVTADLAEARRVHERTLDLAQRGVSTQAEQTRTRARLDVLQAQMAQAQAVLEAARSAALVEKSLIRAPFAGIVLERTAEPGEMISPNAAAGATRTSVAVIADRASIEIEVDISEAYIKLIRAGRAVEATLDAFSDVKLPARVKSISPAASREKGTVRVRVVLDAPDARVLPDMSAHVVFQPNYTLAASEAGDP